MRKSYRPETALSIYDEFERLYPAFWRDIFEMVMIWKARAKQLEAVQSEIEQILKDYFVTTCSESRLEEWEQFMKIDYMAGRSIEDRRKTVIANLIGTGHIGKKEIMAIVAVYTDAPCTVTFDDGNLLIEIARDAGDEYVLSDVRRILEKRLPAHLGWDVSTNTPIDGIMCLVPTLTEWKEEDIG